MVRVKCFPFWLRISSIHQMVSDVLTVYGLKLRPVRTFSPRFGHRVYKIERFSDSSLPMFLMGWVTFMSLVGSFLEFMFVVLVDPFGVGEVSEPQHVLSYWSSSRRKRKEPRLRFPSPNPTRNKVSKKKIVGCYRLTGSSKTVRTNTYGGFPCLFVFTGAVGNFLSAV